MKFGVRRSGGYELLGALPIVGRWFRRLGDRFLLANFRFHWRFGRNVVSRRRWRSEGADLNATQRGIVQDLMRDGIAFASILDLIPLERFEALKSIVTAFGESKKVSEEMIRYRGALKSFQEGSADVSQKATLERYWITLYRDDRISSIDFDDPWLRLGLEPCILDTANAYLKLWSKLDYFDLWHTIPVGDAGSRFGSQKWHRDPEDWQKVRVYLYFSHVGPRSGALQYVRGSQRGGRYGDLFPRLPLAKAFRIPEGELERLAPASEWTMGVGEPGTIIFCDTIGIHRGGASIDSPRVLATWSYLTPASPHKQRYQLKSPEQAKTLRGCARYAVG